MTLYPVSTVPSFELFFCVGNIKSKLKWFFKLKLKCFVFNRELGDRAAAQGGPGVPAPAAGRAGGGAGPLHKGAHRGPQGQADRAGGGAQGWIHYSRLTDFNSDLSRISSNLTRFATEFRTNLPKSDSHPNPNPQNLTNEPCTGRRTSGTRSSSWRWPS